MRITNSIAPRTGARDATSLIVACFGNFKRTASSISAKISMVLALYSPLASQGSGLEKSWLMHSVMVWFSEDLAMRSNWLNSG